MSEELKPCPFCGKEADTSHETNTATAFCLYCTAEIRGFDKAQAIQRWNRRSQPQPTPTVAKIARKEGDAPCPSTLKDSPGSSGKPTSSTPAAADICQGCGEYYYECSCRAAPVEAELFKKFGGVKAVQLWEEQLAENSRLQAELEQAKEFARGNSERCNEEYNKRKVAEARLATAEADTKRLDWLLKSDNMLMRIVDEINDDWIVDREQIDQAKGGA